MGTGNFSKDLAGMCFVALVILGASLVTVKGSMNLRFTEHVIATDYDGALHTEVVDIDLDGDMDLITSASDGNTVSLWKNEGNVFTEQVIDDAFVDVIHIHADDLDQDGDIDIMGGSQMGNELAWWENEAMTFTKRSVATGIFRAKSLYSGDIDQDGDLDLFSTSNNEVAWWENDGHQVFSKHTLMSRLTSSSRSFIRYIYALDLDNDSDIDFISGDNIWAPNPTEDTIYYWLNDGHQVFSQNTLDGITYAPFHGFKVCDLDRDGDLDLCTTNPAQDQIDWFENDGYLNFTQHTITTTFDAANSVDPNDLDGDGDLDLVAAAYLADKISWFENTGNQSFQEHVLREQFDGAHYALAADINQDGHQDIVALAWEADEVIWLEQTTDTDTTSSSTVFSGISSVIGIWMTAHYLVKRRKSHPGYDTKGKAP